MKWLKGLAFLLALGLSVSAFGAATRYVSTTGTDSGACPTGARCATVRYAISQMATDNDTVSVEAGTYYNQPSWSTSGRTCSTLCTVTAESGPKTAIFIFDDTTAGPNGSAGYSAQAAHSSTWGTIGVSHWKVDALELQNNTSALSFFTSTTATTDVEITRNYSFAAPLTPVTPLIIATGTSSMVVTGNTAWGHWPGCASGSACGSQGSDDCDFNETPLNGNRIFSFDGTDSLTFQTNTFGYARNIVQLKNISTGGVWSRNRCINPNNHSCFEMYDIVGATIENNVVDRDDSNTNPTGTTCPAGLTCSCQDETAQGSLLDLYCGKNITIRNNTVIGHGLQTSGQSYADYYSTPSGGPCTGNGGPNLGDNHFENIYNYNNLLYPDGGAGDCMEVNLTQLQGSSGSQPKMLFDYNFISHCPSGYIARTGGTTTGACPGGNCISWAQWQAADFDQNGTLHDIHGNPTVPAFVNYGGNMWNGDVLSTGHDYHPVNATAPQVGAGVTATTVEGVALDCPATDFDGTARTDGGCDVGAFEYYGLGCNPAGTNGVKDPGELCDTFDFGTDNCQAHGYAGGTLTCDVTCQIITFGACTGSVSFKSIFHKVFGG